MTTYPAPQQPNYGPPPAGGRPGVVTAFAIIGIVFGGLGLLCKPFSLIALFVPQAGPNPAVDMQKDLMGWTLFSAVAGTLISILLLASSIGALSLKPWARKGLLAYAAVAVLMNLVNIVVSIIWIMPKMKTMQEQMIKQQGTAPPGMAAIMQGAGTAGAVIGFLITMIFPLLLLYFFTRPNVVAAFEGGGMPPGGYGAGPYGGAPAAGGYYAQPPGSFPPPQA